MPPTSLDDHDAVSAHHPSQPRAVHDPLLVRCAAVIAILPMIVAALRNGLTGWYPTLDAAMVTLRSRDVLSSEPPLVGMWASVSTSVGHATYFPGAIQLYALSVPVHLLGAKWGTLLTMGALNATWVLVAGWLAGRRLGPRGAILTYLAFATLAWSLGSEVLVDAAPMQMVTIPFALFLVAVWAVADGDLVAIPVLTFIANFLVLDHLVMTFLVPVVGVLAPIGLIINMRHERREQAAEWPALKRRSKQMLALSAAIMFVLWIPPLYQQITRHRGNLTNLWDASQLSLGRRIGYGRAFDAVVSILTHPPFWFRNSFVSPHFGGESIQTSGLLSAILFLLLFVVLLGLAIKRQDRTVVAMLAVVAVVVVASVVNITKAPSPYGFRGQYVRSLWSTAMFVWLVLAVAVARSIPWRGSVLGSALRQQSARIGVVAVLIMSGLTLPHKDPGVETNGTTDQAAKLADQTISQAVKALRGKRQVEVFAVGTFTTYALMSSLVLALDSAGLRTCVPDEFVAQYARRCDSKVATTRVAVESAVFPANPFETSIAEGSTISVHDELEFQALTGRVAHWLSTQKHLRVTPSVHVKMAAYFGEKTARKGEADSLDPGMPNLAALAITLKFAVFVDARSEKLADGTIVPAIETGSFPAKDLVRWAHLAMVKNAGSVRIAIQHQPAPN